MNQKAIKAIIVFLSCFSAVQKLSAQDVTLDAYQYKGGYNISCYGQSDGRIDATPVGGTAPYSCSWSNGATTEDVSGLTAGTYTLTVTDAASHTVTKSVTLYEADALTVSLSPSDYGSGYAISTYGGSDGVITASAGGGATPYTYAWSVTGTKEFVNGLAAGSYSVTVTDQNGCAVAESTTLTQPDPLRLSYTLSEHNGYNVTCAGGNDGSITLTGSGGIPPYSFNGDMEAL